MRQPDAEIPQGLSVERRRLELHARRTRALITVVAELGNAPSDVVRTASITRAIRQEATMENPRSWDEPEWHGGPLISESIPS